MKKLLMTLTLTTMMLTGLQQKSQAVEVAAGVTVGVVAVASTVFLTVDFNDYITAAEAMEIQRDLAILDATGEAPSNLATLMHHLMEAEGIDREEAIADLDLASLQILQ